MNTAVDKFLPCDRRYTTVLGTCHDQFDAIASVRAETQRLREEQQKQFELKLAEMEMRFQEKLEAVQMRTIAFCMQNQNSIDDCLRKVVQQETQQYYEKEQQKHQSQQPKYDEMYIKN